MSPTGSGERLTGTGMLSAWRTRLWEVKELTGTKTGVDAHRRGNGNCRRMGKVEQRQPLCELRELMENLTHFSFLQAQLNSRRWACSYPAHTLSSSL